MGESLKKLPPSWVMATVGEVFDVLGGGTPSTETEEYWGGTTPWITSADIEGVRRINVRKYVSDKGIAESTTNKVPAKTLLVVTRVGLGKVAISDVPLCFSQDLQGLIQSPELIVPEYALHLLSYQLQFLKFAGQGTTISGVTKKQLKDLAFPLPPTAEQHRVVAKIEELFSELDQGVASLKTAREQLKVYRQSLLKNAFEGKLTATWRAAHADQLETATALQQRIAHERQARYQQQLADWQTAGQPGPKPNPPKPLQPLTAEELAELPELPAGWVFVRAEEIADFITKGTTPSKELLFSGNGEIPFIKVYNLTMTGALDFSIDPTFVSRETHKGFLSRSKVYPGDVLMNIVGPPLGKVSIVPPTYPEWNINQAIAIFRSTAITPKLLAKYLAHETTVRSMMKKSKATAGQFNLTLEICRETLIPLCGKLEQQEIELLIDEKLSEADQLDQTLASALQQADALRQSILKKAFHGQLVKQDKNEEPATALLERIRAEKSNGINKPGKRGKSG